MKRVSSDNYEHLGRNKGCLKLQIVFTPRAVAVQCNINTTLEVSLSIFTLEL